MTDPTEPVIASLHAVAQRATSLSVLLYSIEQTTTDGQLREFAAEISMFGTMLQNFQSVLSDFGTKQMAKPALWEDLQGVLQLMQEICDAVESLISSTKGSLGKAAIHLGRNKAKWQHARKRLEVVKSTLILMMSVIRLAGETYGIPKLQQSLESAREDFANLSFVHSISARYQRYLDPDHGLKFVPSESHKLSLDSNE
ncbi:hypothetical protein DM02DRAFT_305454 [Periconia macrospinosa]|uniref:Fungal N-terminal domain-containing protein n=1 Tax=Periconia macrospinosa TaxID=97972 RepID=A0A2V1D312_9PLEO|nr:hypothetical protein DM02DRAFT_305454 [Periconia macrospinosa]